MHRYEMLLVVVGLIVLAACSGGGMGSSNGSTDQNPLLVEWNTPFGAPPFDLIEEHHLQPAFDAAIAEQSEEIRAIVDLSEAPTFANTVEALERSGQRLDEIRLVFVNLNMADSTQGLRDLAKVVNPQLAGHRDDILLNAELFVRVKSVYEQRESLDLSSEQARLLEKTYNRFVRGGADLEGEAKQRLREVNAELTTLSTEYGENLLKAMNAVALLLDDEADLAGLPQSVRDSAAAVAAANGHDGAWAFNLQRTSWTPFLQYSERRDLREKLYRAYTELALASGVDANPAIAAKIAALRVERANLLGFPTHAAYVLDDNMAETPAAVDDLLAQLWAPALERAKGERAELQQLARKLGDDIEIRMWDWSYYSEKLRAAKYNFDEEQVKPYLELGSVRAAAFDVATRLWGLSFVERADVPVYHPDVVAYEVKDADGSHLGLFYVDYFARESKRGGAWMENFRQQWKEDGADVRPVIVNVCNFSKPVEGSPALLSLDEAGTLFHEFGHAIHGLLADGEYASLSGTNVARDFVELPSQMMENWAFAPEFMPTYARHVETGEPIPTELVTKLESSKLFNQGFETTEYLAASILDMRWHTLDEVVAPDAMAFEESAMSEIGLIQEIVSRYRTPYFGHIFSGGYSAGYYSYIWAEVLDADGFEAFKTAGLFDAELAASYRENILAAGDSEEPMVLYERFRGQKPTIDALLERRGLN